MVVGVNPRRALDDAYRGFLDLAAGHFATAIANARAYRGGTPPRRGAGRARPRQDHVLLQCQPRVPHAAHAAAGAARGGARRGDALPPAQVERLAVAHRNGLRLLKLVNSLLDFSRIEAGRVQARLRPGRSRDAHRRARRGVPLRDRARRAAARPSLPRRCPRRCSSIATCGRRWCSTSSPTPSSSPSKAAIAVALRPSADGSAAELDSARHRHRHRRRTSCRACSSASTASRARRAGPTKAPASASPWCRNWCGCTAARSGSRARRARAAASPSRSRSARRTCRPSRRRRTAPAASTGLRARAMMRGGAALAARGRRAGRRAGGRGGCRALALPAAAPRGRVLVADDNADMRDYLRRLLAGTGYAVTAAADGEAALAAARAAPPDLVLADVMMPRLRRVRPAARAARRPGTRAPAGHAALGPRRRGGADRGAGGRVPTTT